MQKKIVAVSLIILMVALLLASCGNKYLMGEFNGVERPLVTDAEGNTELDDEGKIAVYVTDAKGNIQYDADGNPEKRYYDLPEKLVKGNTLETSAYKFTAPDGWTLKENGIFYKNGTDDNVSIQWMKDTTLTDGKTYEAFLAEKQGVSQDVLDALKEENMEVEENVTKGSLLSGEPITMIERTTKSNSDGSIYYYASVYVNIGNDVYSANCGYSGSAKDESFNLMDIVSSNLVIKK